MKKRLTSFLLVLALSFSLCLPAFAVDDMNFYSLPSVGSGEPSLAMDWPVNPAEFSNSDSQTLTNIYKYIQYLTLSPASWQSNSIIGFLDRILDAIPSNLGTNFALQGSNRGTNVMLDEIAKWTMFSYNYLSSDNIAGNLGNIQRNTLASADRLLSLVNAVSGIDGYATESTLSSLFSYLSDKRFNAYFDGSFHEQDFFEFYEYLFGDTGEAYYLEPGKISSYLNLMSRFSYALTSDSNNFLNNDTPTLYRMVKLLQETLASEDDRQLAENYKENREQAESDFLSGKSGKTSLGKGDFSNASQVGGALNDTFNMGGASKVSDFLSGFGSAGTESQVWFSQTTANNLNAVEAGDGTQGVSTFADDGETMVDVDPDPYNMTNIFERYDWLEGVNMYD